jgi:hypothetical protein
VALAAGDRVLVKNQNDTTQNGIYNASSGQWAASSDFQNATQIDNGCQVFVTAGAVNGRTLWSLSATDPVVPGVSAIAFVPPGAPLGYLSSVGLVMPASTFVVAGSPRTTDGDLTVTLQSQAANTALLGPAGGGPATPTWRAPVLADLPAAVVSGPNRSLSANIPAFSGNAGNELTDTGFPKAGLPWTIGQQPAAIPSQSTVTITIGAPAVFTWAGHGLAPNMPIVLTTTGALPSPLTGGADPGTEVYVCGGNGSIGINDFQVSASLADAIAGIPITTTGTQSGVHTAYANLDPDVGNVGESIAHEVAIADFVTMSVSGQTYTIASYLVPAGRWRSRGNVVFSAQLNTAYTELHASISTTDNVMDGSPSGGSGHAIHVDFITGQSAVWPTGERTYRFTVPTHVYLVATVTQSGSPMLAYGGQYFDRL